MQAQYNQANRLTQLTLYPNTPQAKTYVLDYDLEGNLIKKKNSTDTSCIQDCTEYVWDANNRLAQLKIKGQTTAVYSYDAQGRRVEASISTSNNGTPQTNTVQYIYEGNQAVGEVRNGQLSHSLLTGLFIDEHLARTSIATNGQTQSQAQLTDALGSVIALANAQTLSINTSYSYSPYGQTQATGENSSSNQQYTGREAGVEGEAGLYYYRARYYDPVLKRFISEDPIRLGGGLNVYAYVEGDPVSNIDPMGLQAVTIPSPRITWPKLPPVAVPPSLAPVVIGGLIGWGVGNLINPIVQPPLSTAVDWCMKNNTDDCDKEWEDALKMCKDLNKKKSLGTSPHYWRI